MKLFLLFALTLNLAHAQDCFRQKKEVADNDFKVSISHYPGSLQDKHIFIIPPTGGINLVDRSYGRKLCFAGFNATIIETWTDHDEYNLEIPIHTRFYARAQRAVDVVKGHFGQVKYLGILGTSVGGLHASIAGGRVPEIKGIFIITGGADIASIIVDSSQTAMEIARKKRKTLYGFEGREDYLAAVREVIELEPLNYNYLGKDTGMVLATEDDVVPTRNQLMLKNQLKPASYFERNGSHFWTIVKFWFMDSDEVVDFFLKSSGDLT